MIRLSCLLMLLFALGCENKLDDKANVLPKVQVDAGDLPQDATASGATCGCLAVGQTYRFTELKLTSIAGDPDANVISTLNNLWQQDIDHGELDFFFQVTEVTDDHVHFRVVNGARTDEPKSTLASEKCSDSTQIDAVPQICLLDDPKTLDTSVPIAMPRKGYNLLDSEPTGINVYAGTPENTKNCAPTLPIKHSIPVRNAVLRARVGNDCQTIEDGLVLTGGFAVEALSKICTCVTSGKQLGNCCATPDPNFKDGLCDGCNTHYQNLKTLLEAFNGGVEMDHICDSDKGKEDSICLTATFKAVRIAAPPPSCKSL